jgi:hypothetical protein
VDEFCAGDSIPEATLRFDEDGSGFSVDGHMDLRPWDRNLVCEFFRARQPDTFDALSSPSGRLDGQVVEGGIHGHGSHEGKAQLPVAQQ